MREYLVNDLAEIEVLGSICKDNSLMELMPLATDIFYSTKHKNIYEKMKQLRKNGMDIDIITLSENLPNGVTMTDIVNITNTVATTENFGSHLKILEECRTKRAFYQVLNKMDYSDTSENIVEKIQKVIDNSLVTKEETVPTREYTYEYLEKLYNPQKESGIKTGLTRIDEMTGGFKKGQLITLAGYTGTGKSILATQLMNNMIHKGIKVDFFTLEMGRDEILDKLMSNSCGVDFGRLFRGQPTEEDLKKITEFISVTAPKTEYEIYEFEDDINRIIQQIKKDKFKNKVDIVFIDLINRVTDSTSKDSNRANFLGSITRRLKLLAGKLQIPIVITAQINRNVEHRDSARPTLADIKESGGIAEDSDYVFGLYRNRKFDDIDEREGVSKADLKTRDAEVNPNVVEISILKGRNVPTLTMAYYWQPKYQRIANLDFNF